MCFDVFNNDEIINLTDSILSFVSELLASGVDNIEMSNDPKILAMLSDFFTSNTMTIKGSTEYKSNLRPIISLIDDDTIDNQIPDSKGATTPSENTGGYFSVLFPITLSLATKHHKDIPVGLACEGHRVGLTTFKQSNDDYSALNTNGNAVRWLHDKMGWNVLNHSMTAQLPQRSYYVDGIDSELAGKILTQGYYSGYLSFSNTCVLDRLSGKWYEVNSTKTAWVERTPTKKYAQPFYREYTNADDPNASHAGPWYFNRDFDFDYSWGEWERRASELGLPYEKVIVHNGGTSSVWTASAGRKYAYFSVRTSGIYNNPPIAATVNRADADPSDFNGQGYNVWNDAWVLNREKVLQKCIEDKSWVVFMSHTNDQEYFRNYYLNGRDYPSAEAGQPELRGKDSNYPNEWIVPLKYNEIMDIIGDNVHDYINHPPSRLEISSWDEWHPAPGTHLAAWYYILDKALDMGIDIVTPMDGWKTHGNILNLGVDRNGQKYTYDSAEKQTPYTDEEMSYLTIGADMSIRYSFNPTYNTDLSNPDITISVAVDSQPYNGFALTPEIIVKDNGITLVNGIHYTVSYKNNTNAGTAIVIITGKGHYTGTQIATFTIEKAYQDLTWEQEFEGVVVEEEIELLAKVSSELDVEYSVSDESIASIEVVGKKAFLICKAPGSVTVKATQKGNENYYKSNTISKNIRIHNAPDQFVPIEIKLGEQGAVSTMTEIGLERTFFFSVETGWKIHSVTFNGKDVTNEVWNNSYTTPIISEASSLIVAYEDDGSSVSPRRNSEIRVTGNNEVIHITGTKLGDTISIYDEDGKIVAKQTSTSSIIDIPLNKDKMYIVNVGDLTIKILL